MKSAISDSLMSAFNKCLFLYDKQEIGNSDFVGENSRIIAKTLSGANQNRGMIIHQGSNIPFYLTVILSSFASFLCNDDENLFF